MTVALPVTLVAAMGRNRVIGLDGDMPWHFSEDLAHFKRTTMGGTMLMGRKTFDSIGRPLPGRRTIVITRNTEWAHDGVEVVHSLGEALELAANSEPQHAAGVFVVGGGDVYAQALPIADRLVLTEIDDAPEGDTYFPEWSRDEWAETARHEAGELAFVTWERV
jgi:dihydrofolate reductase